MRILILGASSFVGRHLFSRLGPNRAIATYYSRPLPGAVRFDALSTPLTDIVDPAAVSHAVILFAETNPDACARDAAASATLNVARTKLLIDQLRQHRIVPVFTSTEAVFDGDRGHYVETDAVGPRLLYGKQKVEIERYIEETCDDFVIARLARVFGSEPGDRTLLTEWLAAVARDADIRCAVDQVFSPIHVGDVAEAIVRLIDSGSRGVFHVAGPAACRRIDILAGLVDGYRAYRPYRGRIIECSIHDFDVVERRPLNLSLSTVKLQRATGLVAESSHVWCQRLLEHAFETQLRG